MKDFIKVSALACAIMALAGTGAYAAPGVKASTTINIGATVASNDAVDCSATGSYVEFGDELVPGATSAAQLISCNVTDNDAGGVDMYVYGMTALTGTNVSTNTIPLTNLEFEAIGGSDYMPFADVSTATGVAGAIGGKVYSGLAEGLNATPENFNLELNVPAGQQADTYTTTLTIGIVPAAS